MASALKDGMLLGGNLPDSLSQYLYHGHDDEYEVEGDGHDHGEITSDKEKI